MSKVPNPNSKPAPTAELLALHDEAVARGEPFYVDPATGYLVATRVTLLNQGRCCGSGCRHCPYEDSN